MNAQARFVGVSAQDTNLGDVLQIHMIRAFQRPISSKYRGGAKRRGSEMGRHVLKQRGQQGQRAEPSVSLSKV